MMPFSMPDQHSQELEQAIGFLTRSTENGGIYGLTGSGPEFVIAAAVSAGARNLVLVQPDGDAAARVAANIRFYLGTEELFDRPLEDRVLLYPSSDALPYSVAGFETEVAIARMACLYRLAEVAAPRVTVVGLDALMAKVVPRAAISAHSFSIAVGEELDRELLLQRLVAAGYSRAPLVEDAGEFSVRGFIIDLYPPLYPYPVRIEQTGDRVESLRFFDPSNQRSRQEVAGVLISPICMTLVGQDSLERGLQRLVERCESQGVEKRVRQKLVDDFRNRIRFPGVESYLPYFFPRMDSLLDYLGPEAALVLPDESTIARSQEECEEQVMKGWESAASEGLPVARPEELYLSRHDLSQKLAEFRRVTMSPLEIEEPGQLRFRLRCASNGDVRSDLLKTRAYDAAMAGLVRRLDQWRGDGNEVLLVSHTRGQGHRLLSLLEPYSLKLDFRGEGLEPANLTCAPAPGIRVYVGELSAGFRMEEAHRIVLTEEEIFGSRVRTAPRKRARGSLIASLTDLAEGEPVVHEEYGIGIFRGLARKEFDGVPGEVMVIEYAGGDLLYHPVERLQFIQKYMSASEVQPRIDRLGTKTWARTKAKVKQSIRDMARDLLDIYARRQVSGRKPYSPPDEHFAEFEASFEFEETPDQAVVIQEIMEAMDTDRPMDRVVCGDVGYGKTEVALRAAFRAVMDGKQVAILVPTTVLAQQHYETVFKRFNGYPITVDVLSRFRSSPEQKQILQRLAQGKLDLIIGTHRLLQKDVQFHDLGLLVVDEEHRFGVAHKERIKKYKAHVDILTLTATPIPRTLNMSLSGIRDLSVIDSPPPNRKSIRTHVVRQSEEVIRDALLREVTRGGQAFFIHNRVRSIYRRAATLKGLVPEASFGVAHGQMGSRELEKVMLDFVAGKFNVLVCTSIIESGLDMPRVNTIIIERADTFGLADLYQLRGRVGRSSVRAYAYLLTPPEIVMTQDAIKRLAVLQEHSDLGQGFRIAMRDMEIRGAGNILGSSQSGHVNQVGYEMYLTLLEQAVQEIKGEPPAPRIDPEIRLRIEALIPEDYVPDPQQRMNLYKRLSRASENEEIERVEQEMVDLYGRPPREVSNLLQVMGIRLAMKERMILRLDYNERDLVVTFHPDTPVRPELLVSWARRDPKNVRLVPGDRLMYRIGQVDPQARIAGCFSLLKGLEGRLSPNLARSETRDILRAGEQ